jgi:RNA polymerase sigma-70 factor (ECF subfamily)
MDSQDAKLVAACQEGDRYAQQQLFNESHAKVYRLMVRMVGLQDASDVTQQVYLQVYRKIDQFAGRSRLGTWIYRVAVNEALQHLRSKTRTSTQTLEYEPVDHAPSHENSSDLAEVLEAAIADLDPQLRSIFLLREVEELPYNAIADVLDIPEGTVGSRLNRARRELQQRLVQLGWGP